MKSAEQQELQEKMLLVHHLADEDDLDGATKAYNQYLKEHFGDPRMLGMAGYVELKKRNFGLAYVLFKESWKAMPCIEFANNVGMAALGCYKLEESEEILKKGLEMGGAKHHVVSCLNNLATVKVNQCEPEVAVTLCKRIEQVDPDSKVHIETLGYAELMLGRWETGWRNFDIGSFLEEKWERFDGLYGGYIRRARSYAGEKYWKGPQDEPVKTLVVRGEQGIGDEVCYASVFDSVAKDCDRLIIECDRRLVGLFQRSFPYEVYGTRFEKTLDWHAKPDAHVLSGSLCTHYRASTASFPGKPYLIADPDRRLQWRALLDSLGDKPKIGIAWKGGRFENNSQKRTLPLEAFLPILQQDATFVSLEYKDPSSEIEAFEERHGIKIHHWARASEAKDYDEVAALVAELDLVISVQTAVVHLSGALGKECWVLVPSKPHWRYGMTGDSMPWYESVKLYRQKNDWGGIIKHVSQELKRKWTTRLVIPAGLSTSTESRSAMMS